MRGEYYIQRSQLKGYMFEIVILQLLNNNGFTLINNFDNKIREDRFGFVELRGRGCWHQIDCPCDYNKLMPFIYPIRLLGEVKFHSNEVKKDHIREYIGIIKDIQENYFVSDNIDANMIFMRRLEIGVYFSANGFDDEAEKLAYAHGIKTISYQNNYLIDRIKNLINEIESNFLFVRCISRDNQNNFKKAFRDLLLYGEYRNVDYNIGAYAAEGYLDIINQIRQILSEIRSSFIGTTSTGVFLHFVGDNVFPHALFSDTDEGQCEVYYNTDSYGKRYFYLTITGDERRSKFYFTPPESLDEAATFGREIVLDEKARIFRAINVNININNINRNLILHLNGDWLNQARQQLDN